MANIELLITFFVTSALFAFVPGPAMLYAAAHVMAGGRRAGMRAVLGIHIGAYAHIIATAAGLTWLLQTVPLLYSVLKIAGALYLIWLGARMIFSSRAKQLRELDENTPSSRLSQSILVELLNPKTALFFLAYLPQFVDPSAALPIWMQLALLGFIVNLLFTLADVIVVFGASTVTTKLQGQSALQTMVQRMGGSVLIGMGADLMLRKQ